MMAIKVSFTAAMMGSVPIHAEAADLTTSRLLTRGAAESVATIIAKRLSAEDVVDVGLGRRYESINKISKYGASEVYTPVEEA